MELSIDLKKKRFPSQQILIVQLIRIMVDVLCLMIKYTFYLWLKRIDIEIFPNVV